MVDPPGPAGNVVMWWPGLTLGVFAPRKHVMIRSKSGLALCRYGSLLSAFLFFGASLPALAEFKVGLVLDRGGKDDKSFNTSAYEGCSLAKSKFGITLK
jgi:basic membrane lipoprotein Med (substrate-binding protein (PBP1-ABC) superfamily)